MYIGNMVIRNRNAGFDNQLANHMPNPLTEIEYGIIVGYAISNSDDTLYDSLAYGWCDLGFGNFKNIYPITDTRVPDDAEPIVYWANLKLCRTEFLSQCALLIIN